MQGGSSSLCVYGVFFGSCVLHRVTDGEGRARGARHESWLVRASTAVVHPASSSRYCTPPPPSSSAMQSESVQGLQ